MVKPPVILIISANPHKDLLKIDHEIEIIKKIFKKEVLKGYLLVETIRSADPKKFIAELRDYQDQLVIFHYLGHANEESYLLEGNHLLSAKNVSEILSSAKKLRLALLNACNTQAHINYFFSIGAKAVITTNSSINDSLASEFSKMFYEGLNSNQRLCEAFKNAKIFLQKEQELPDVIRIYPHRRFNIGDSWNTTHNEFPWGLNIQNENDLILKNTLHDILHAKAVFSHTENEKGEFASKLAAPNVNHLQIIVTSTIKEKIKEVIKKNKILSVVAEDEKNKLINKYGKNPKDWKPYLKKQSKKEKKEKTLNIEELITEFLQSQGFKKNIDIYYVHQWVLENKSWQMVSNVHKTKITRIVIPKSILIADCITHSYYMEQNGLFTKTLDDIIKACIVPVCGVHGADGGHGVEIKDFIRDIIANKFTNLHNIDVGNISDPINQLYYFNIQLDVLDKRQFIKKLKFIANHITRGERGGEIDEESPSPPNL